MPIATTSQQTAQPPFTHNGARLTPGNLNPVKRQNATLLGRCQRVVAGYARRCALLVLATVVPSAWAQVDIPLNSGWNLVGNAYYASSNVESFAPQVLNSDIVSMWKWLPSSRRWAFYAPSLTSEVLATYASSKGYDVLTRIEPGEGVWINTKAATKVRFHATTPAAIPTAAFQAGSLALQSGWNLIAVGDGPTPREFANGIANAVQCPNSTLVAALCPDDVAAMSITTLWAWASQNSTWNFYAPNLDNLGTLASYRTDKGYGNFTSAQATLSPTTGFWVNKP